MAERLNTWLPQNARNYQLVYNESAVSS